MISKAEAESRLAKCALIAPVTVDDVGITRRKYTYATPLGSLVEIEIDAVPTDRQLQDLSLNLPMLDKDRAAALAIFKAP